MTTNNQIIIYVAMIFCLLFCGGLALSILWGWFIAPVFMVNKISVMQGIGILLVVKLLKGGFKFPTNEIPIQDDINDVLFTIGAYLFFVIVGWALNSFKSST